MVSIIKALGEKYRDIRLADNESPYGGKAHSEETLGEFMDGAELKGTDDYGELCIELEECGLEALRPMKYINFGDNGDETIRQYLSNEYKDYIL